MIKVISVLILTIILSGYSPRFLNNTPSNFFPFTSSGTTGSTGSADTMYPPTMFQGSYYMVFKNSSGFLKLYKWDGNTLSQPLGVNGTCGATSCNDLNPYSSASKNKPQMIVYNDALYFPSNNSSGFSKLYKWDGTTLSQPLGVNGTCGATSCNDFLQSNMGFVLYNSKIYFDANNSSGFDKMYTWDGATLAQPFGANGTCGASSCADSIFTTFTNPIVFGGSIYFSANNSSAKTKVHKWDGTTLSQPLGANGTCGAPSCADLPIMMTEYNSELYFLANFSSGTTYYKWHKWNGTTLSLVFGSNGTSGSSTVSDLPTTSSIVNGTFILNGKLYFPSKASGTYNRLHYWDGSTLSVILNSSGICGTTTCHDWNVVRGSFVTSSSVYFSSANSSNVNKIFNIDSNNNIYRYQDLNSSNVHDVNSDFFIAYGKICFSGILSGTISKFRCITRF